MPAARRARPRRGTGRRRPAAPPGPRPRMRRSARSAGPAPPGPAAPPGAAGPRCGRSHLRPRLVHHRTHLDRAAVARVGPAARDVERALLALDVDRQVAAELLLGLG